MLSINYEPTKAGRAIQYFVNEHLSNWYVRLYPGAGSGKVPIQKIKLRLTKRYIAA